MKKQLYSVILLFVAFSCITGCSKDKDEDAPPEKTNTELISTGTWKFSTATVSGINVAGFIQNCQKDNTMTFQANGNGALDEGTTKCNVADPQSVPFTWNFESNETILHVSTVLFTGGSSDFNVVEISETKLSGSQMADFGAGPQNVVVTFVH